MVKSDGDWSEIVEKVVKISQKKTEGTKNGQKIARKYSVKLFPDGL